VGCLDLLHLSVRVDQHDCFFASFAFFTSSCVFLRTVFLRRNLPENASLTLCGLFMSLISRCSCVLTRRFRPSSLAPSQLQTTAKATARILLQGVLVVHVAIGQQLAVVLVRVVALVAAAVLVLG
jgi:hypothetical protein